MNIVTKHEGRVLESEQIISMLLSVVMPVYNAEKRLEIAAGSVLGQTWPDIELILVDDGSKDRSGIICDQIAATDTRVKVIHQSNAGVSAARNRGIAECRGGYIVFVDADDTVDSVAFEQIMQSLIEKPVDIYMFGMSFDYYKSDSLVKQKDMRLDRELLISSSKIGRYFLTLYDCNYLTSSCNKFFRASLLRQNDLKFSTDMALLEDLKFTLDALEQCETIGATSKVYYRYYNNLDSHSFKRRPSIDYMENFRILDNRLRTFAAFADMSDDKSLARISAIILRGYLHSVENEFYSGSTLNQKRKYISSFLDNEDVSKAAQQAVPFGIRMKLLCYLIKRKKKTLLFVLFFIMSGIARLKERFL